MTISIGEDIYGLPVVTDGEVYVGCFLRETAIAIAKAATADAAYLHTRNTFTKDEVYCLGIDNIDDWEAVESDQ